MAKKFLFLTLLSGAFLFGDAASAVPITIKVQTINSSSESVNYFVEVFNHTIREMNRPKFSLPMTIEAHHIPKKNEYETKQIDLPEVLEVFWVMIKKEDGTAKTVCKIRKENNNDEFPFHKNGETIYKLNLALIIDKSGEFGCNALTAYGK